MNQAETEILKKIDEFSCRRCNACCEQPGCVYLKDDEAETIAKLLNMDLYDFTEHFTEVIDRRRLVLKKKEDGGESCIFLTSQGCAVYAARPVQCRDFPRGWRTERSLDYCEGLKALRKVVKVSSRQS